MALLTCIVSDMQLSAAARFLAERGVEWGLTYIPSALDLLIAQQAQADRLAFEAKFRRLAPQRQQAIINELNAAPP